MILYNFLKSLWLSIKYNRIINKVYRDENILGNLSKILNCELKQDWIGRVYAVINPYIKDGQYDPTSEVYELGNDAPVQYVVEKYVMERLIAAQNFIQANNLFDVLTYNIEKLDDFGNCLFTMYPIPYIDLANSGKKFLKVYGTLLVLGLIFLGIFLIV